TDPPLITLSWPADPGAAYYYILRKALSDTSWGTYLGTLPGTASSYSDSSVAVGEAYEYDIEKAFSFFEGSGYIYAGLQAPLVEFRGKVVLIVDNTFTVSLSN